MTTCLLVDDSRTIRRVMRVICEAVGFACSEAADGELALASCRAALPDFILTDWNMPNMSGVDFVRALRQEPGGDKPIIILCTTNNEMAQIEEALAAGANEYIMKPFDADIVRSKLRLLGLIPEEGEAVPLTRV